MTFILAHLSDPHIGPLPHLPLASLLNKRLLGVINWHTRRATIHNMPILDKVIDDIIAQNPDHVALTGDLVNIGSAPEFAMAYAQFERLGSPDYISIVPGNHDAYVRDSLPAMAEHFQAYLLGDDEEKKDAPIGLPAFPYLRLRRNIALIGVNSALPTGPLMATGKVAEDELIRLGNMLQRLSHQGLMRVIMIHHPPYQGGSRFARGLVNAPAFEAVIAQYGAELIIHGHNHRLSKHLLPTPNGTCPVIGVGSASAIPGTPQHCAQYNLIQMDMKDGVIKLNIQTRGYVASTQGVSLLAEMQC